MKNGQVHRFRNRVACYVGGDTAYLTPHEAYALADALLKVGLSCESEEFIKSVCGTFTFTIAGKDE